MSRNNWTDRAWVSDRLKTLCSNREGMSRDRKVSQPRRSMDTTVSKRTKGRVRDGGSSLRRRRCQEQRRADNQNCILPRCSVTCNFLLEYDTPCKWQIKVYGHEISWMEHMGSVGTIWGAEVCAPLTYGDCCERGENSTISISLKQSWCRCSK